MQPAVAIPAVILLVLRAWSNNSLTPVGIIFATVTAAIHAAHPWPVFFALLVVLFLGGTATTKVKHHEKAKLTHSSSGDAGGEGPRNHIQVLANSGVASLLVALHTYQLYQRDDQRRGGLRGYTAPADQPDCLAWGSTSDLLVIGVIAQYAAAAADTWASELGILSKSPPRLITSATFRVVPPGTNGGVSLVGTLAGLAGAMTIALTSVILLPFCRPGEATINGFRVHYKKSPPGLQGGTGWGLPEMMALVLAVTVWGALGSLLDSILGATLQQTVVDAKTGRVVEGKGGRKVPVQAPEAKGKESPGEASRKVVNGWAVLDNNGVNFVTSLTMAVSAMVVAGIYWKVPLAQMIDLS